MKARYLWSISAAAVLAVAQGTCLAEAGDPLTDHFSISLGTFLLNTSTDIRVDGEARTGTDLDLETDLGFDDTDRFRLDGYWRFLPRQKLRLMYFDTRRSETTQLDRDITVGDTVFPLDAVVDTTFDTTVTTVSYEFAFLRGDKYEFAGLFGIHNLKFEFDMRAESQGQVGTLQESADANGPLPVVGLSGIWRFHDKFYLDAQVQYFRISIDPYDGRLSDYNASAVWQAFKHVGFGLGYNEFVTKVGVDGDNFDGDLRWRYGGARIFVTGSF
jgi:hypothetical protein